MKIKNYKLSGKKYLKIYVTVLVLSAIVYYIICYFSKGYYFKSIFFGDINDTFADFFKCVYGWHDNPYAEGIGNYPALAMMMYRFCYHFIPKEISVANGLEYRSINIVWIIFIVYNLFVLWMIYICISNKFKFERYTSNLLIGGILISAPVMFALERGNQINLAFALTLFFSCFYNENNKILKELALFSLAIAAGLKIYPAIYGFILLKEKKWKEAIRLSCYGIVAFFAPFIIYGKGAFRAFITCLTGFSNGQNGRYAYNFSLNSIIGLFCEFIGVENNYILIWKILIVISLIFVYLVNKNKWIEWASLTLLLIWIPSVSDAYVLLFMIIPFFLFDDYVNSVDFISKKDIYSSLVFGFLFTPLALPIIERFSTYNYILSWSYIVYFISLILLWIHIIVNTVLSIKQMNDREIKRDEN